MSSAIDVNGYVENHNGMCKGSWRVHKRRVLLTCQTLFPEICE